MGGTELDRVRTEAFLARAVDSLEGDWLLLGGALAAVWFRAERRTEDIDLIGFGGTQGERLRLMELAESAGLPVEAVNSAADFFVHRIPDWRQRVVPFRQGARATIWRPDTTLFVLLKIGRLSETDLADCLALLDHPASRAEPVDARRLLDALKALGDTPNGPLAARRRQIAERLVG